MRRVTDSLSLFHLLLLGQSLIVHLQIILIQLPPPRPYSTSIPFTPQKHPHSLWVDSLVLQQLISVFLVLPVDGMEGDIG